MKNKDYYSILGISEDADNDAIKKAYRKLAKEYHPDTKPEKEKKEAEEKFKEINEAFSVLIDEQKREQYDYSRLHPDMDFNPHFGGFNNNVDFEDILRQNFGNDFMSDIFSSFFSRSDRRQNNRVINEDIHTEIILEPQDTMNDLKKNISYKRNIFCKNCNGEGGFEPRNCPQCSGTGVERIIRNSGFFQSISETKCSNCYGKGKIFKNICKECNGKGFIQKFENFSINIEKGTVGNIIIKEKGHATYKNAKPGNFVARILYKENKDFTILNDNGDIQTVLQINPINAMLGGEFNIKGLNNTNITVNIPKLCKAGTRLRVKEQGMYLKNRQKRGDLFILVEYLMPETITENQEKALLNYLEIENNSYLKESIP